MDISFRVYCILQAAWRRRYTILLPIIIFPLLGAVIGLTNAKQYKAHTSLLIQETAKLNPFLEDFAVSAMLKERGEALKTLLHSRHILQKVAYELGLIDPDSDETERDAVIGQLSSSLSMTIVGKDLIRIDHRASSPDMMEDFLFSVSNHFIEQLLAPERSSIVDSEIFLSEHLERRLFELETAENALSEFKSAHAEALPELHSMNISRLNRINQTLSEREAELAGSTKTVGGLTQLLSQTNPVIGKIEEQIVKSRSDLALLSARYTDRHSKVQAIKRTLRRLEVERDNAIQSTGEIVNARQLWDIASVQSNRPDDNQPVLLSQLSELQTAKSKTNSLISEISRLKEITSTLTDNVQSFGAKENQLVRLERDLNVKRDLYEEILKRYEMAQVTGSLGKFEQSKRIKIIDRPFTPSSPANMHVLIYILAGAVAGIIFGLGLSVVFEAADTTIRYKNHLEEITGVPVVSRIPPLSLINTITY
ncbi:MAG: hypothetical protein K6L81_16660 [Agarilytica sp.]